MSDYIMDEDEEVGFLPLLGAAGSLLGGLLGGDDDKKGGAPPVLMGAGGASGPSLTEIVAALKGPIEAAGIGQASPLRQVGPDQMRELVKGLVATVPSPVRAQVKAALAQASAEAGNKRSKLDGIVRGVDKKFQGPVKATLKALQLASTQREATSQHNDLVLTDKRWRGVREANRTQQKRLDSIMRRLDALGAHVEQRLGGKLAIVRGGKAIDVLGGRGVLKGADT